MKLFSKDLTYAIKSGFPNEFQRVEWIQCATNNGNDFYIEPNINATNKTKIEFDVDVDFGSWAGFCGGSHIAIVTAMTNTYYIGWGGQSAYVGGSTSGRNTITMDKNKFYINGILLRTFNDVDFVTTEFVLMKSGQNATKSKFYGLKIYEEDVLVRDFIPCYRKNDNTIGFYDLSNNLFYENNGAGTFNKGPDID